MSDEKYFSTLDEFSQLGGIKCLECEDTCNALEDSLRTMHPELRGNAPGRSASAVYEAWVRGRRQEPKD
jgi:hypothetical protein